MVTDFLLCFVAGGVGLRYHLMNNKLGIDKFIDLNTFSNSSNGYLSEDTCVFGVELLVARNKCERGRLSLMKEPLTWSHTWKIKNFSNLVNETYVSKPFGRYQWYYHHLLLHKLNMFL